MRGKNQLPRRKLLLMCSRTTWEPKIRMQVARGTTPGDALKVNALVEGYSTEALTDIWIPGSKFF